MFNPLSILIAAFAALTALWLCLSQFGGLPHVSDEVSYLFQGRILAAGRLWLEPPQIPELFSFGHILITRDRWCSIYSPGWPALLAAGWWMRAPWLLNPLLLFASVLLLFRLVSALYKEESLALAAVALFVASPFVLEMHSGFFSHPALLCFALLCWLLLEKAAISARRWTFAGAGAAAGMCFLIRPFSAVVLLTPIVVYSVARCRQRAGLLYSVLSVLPFLLIYLLYNSTVYGDAFSGGYRLDPSFQNPAFSGEYFGSNLLWYAGELNRRLWGWPFPNLLLFAPLLGMTHLRKPDLAMIACVLSLVLSYSFYYYRDVVLGGPRFAFEATAFLAVLAARSLSLLAEFAKRLLPAARAGAWLCAFVMAAALYSLLIRLPAEWLYHSDSYHGQEHTVVELASGLYPDSSALIRVGGKPFVIGAFYFENALQPADGNRVFVRDLPAREEEIRRLFPRDKNRLLFLKMQELPGSPNSYVDRWRVESLRLCDRCEN